MHEYFIYANSFAAPFCSDDSESYVTAETPEAALEKFVAEYRHPYGLYAAVAYENADAMHKNRKPLARWYCNHELAKMMVTKDKPSYRYYGQAPGVFSIDDEVIRVENPKGGMVVRIDERWHEKARPTMTKRLMGPDELRRFRYG